MDQRPDAAAVLPRAERRSVIRIAGDKLKEYADKLNTNARWLKNFLKGRK